MEIRTITATGGHLANETHTFGSGFQAYREAIEKTGAIYSNYVFFQGIAPSYYSGYNSSDGTYDVDRVVAGMQRNQTNLGTPAFGEAIFGPNGDGTYSYAGPLFLDIEVGNVESIGSNPTYAAALDAFVDDLIVVLPNAQLCIERILCSPSNNSSPASAPSAAAQAITAVLGNACPNIYGNLNDTRDLAWLKKAVEFGIEYSGTDIWMSVSLNKTSSSFSGSGVNKQPYLISDTYWQNVLETAQHTYNGFGVRGLWLYGDSIDAKGDMTGDVSGYSYSQLIEAEIQLIQSAINTLSPRTGSVLA